MEKFEERKEITRSRTNNNGAAAAAHATNSNTYKKNNVFRSKIIIIIGMTGRETTDGACLAYWSRG